MTRPGTTWRDLARKTLTLVCATAVATAGLVVASSVPATAVTLPAAHSSAGRLANDAAASGATSDGSGCSFADAGTGKYASTLCWFDLSAVDPAKASSSQGQPMHITLPGGFSIDMTLNTSGNATAAAALPTFPAAYLGNDKTGYYTGIKGKPALYQIRQGSVSDATLSKIRVTDKNGEPVTGYAFVGADAESTDTRESITWTSDATLRQIGDLGNSCSGGFSGAGTTTVRCAGSPTVPGNKTGAAILAATNPSTFSQHMVGKGMQAVAFGVLVSTVRVDKAVASRANPDDSFTVQVASGSSTLGTGDTGPAGTTASTGDVIVLTGDAGASYTLSEQASSGSLNDYTNNWECTRTGNGQWPLPSGAGTSKDIMMGIGDYVDCTVTNTAKPRALTVTKTTTATSQTRPGDTVNYTVTATNTGEVAYTSAVPAHIVDDLTDVLDDATYNNDAQANVTDGAGALAYTAPRLTWTGSLAIGASVTLRYSVTYTGRGDKELNNVAFAPPHAQAPTPSCQGDSAIDAATGVPCARVIVPVADLQASKSVDPASGTKVVAGQTLTYTLHFHNTGKASATLDYTDDLTRVIDDAHVATSPVASDPALTVSRVTNGRFTVTGSLAAGATAAVTYAVTIVPWAQQGDHVLTNFLLAAGQQPPTNGKCAADSNTCTVNPDPNTALALPATSNTSSGQLAHTGDDLLPVSISGVALLLIGIVLLLTRRRRTA